MKLLIAKIALKVTPRKLPLLFLLTSPIVLANTTPIEPVLVPIVSENHGIDIHIGKYEVTVAEFSRFVNATNYQVPEKCMLFNSTSYPSPETPGNWDNAELIENKYRPVVCIGIAGALAYTDWLSKTTGKLYRLPERNEWLYAASTGKNSRFAFGDDYHQTQICDYENVEDYAGVAGIYRDHNHRYSTSANCNDGAVYHTVVGMYRPNQFGIHDMVGNVKELLQTCDKYNENAPSICKEYVVAGEAWHWQARGVDTPDTIGADFYGSIEGFRIVLDSTEMNKEPASTIAFASALVTVQQEARKAHQQLKSLPVSPLGLKATQIKSNQVKLSWIADLSDEVTYAVYRSYIDPERKLSRKPEQIAEGIKNTHFVDEFTGKGVVTYTVFAKSAIGESMASNEAHIGIHPTFKIGERIPAEHFKTQRNSWIRYDKQGQGVGFSANNNHYATGEIPFLPA